MVHICLDNLERKKQTIGYSAINFGATSIARLSQITFFYKAQY